MHFAFEHGESYEQAKRRTSRAVDRWLVLVVRGSVRINWTLPESVHLRSQYQLVVVYNERSSLDYTFAIDLIAQHHLGPWRIVNFACNVWPHVDAIY
jgi:hypothetical protein